MKEFAGYRAKTYSYLMDDNNEKKKLKGTKKCVIKRKARLNDYEDCLLKNRIILKPHQRLSTSNYHNAYTDKINQIALSSNDDKRLHTFDKITICPYGTNAVRVCESEVLSIYK